MLTIDRLSVRLPAEIAETPELLVRRIGHELLPVTAGITGDADHVRAKVRMSPGGDIAAHVASALRSKLGSEPWST